MTLPAAKVSPNGTASAASSAIPTTTAVPAVSPTISVSSTSPVMPRWTTTLGLSPWRAPMKTLWATASAGSRGGVTSVVEVLAPVSYRRPMWMSTPSSSVPVATAVPSRTSTSVSESTVSLVAVMGTAAVLWCARSVTPGNWQAPPRGECRLVVFTTRLYTHECPTTVAGSNRTLVSKSELNKVIYCIFLLSCLSYP